MSINNNLRLQIENFCKKIGTNKSLVYGAGGNISWKESGLLWIKSSGTNLADAKKYICAYSTKNFKKKY